MQSHGLADLLPSIVSPIHFDGRLGEPKKGTVVKKKIKIKSCTWQD